MWGVCQIEGITIATTTQITPHYPLTITIKCPDMVCAIA